MTQTCQRCGLDVPQGRDVCPNCGAAVRKTGKVIRCQHCLHRAPSHLTICPHCGRRLQPWRPYRALAVAGVIVLLVIWLNFFNGWRTVSSAGAGLVALVPAPATLAPTATAMPTLEPTRTPVAVVVLSTPTQQPLDAPTPTMASVEATATPEPASTDTPTPTATVTGDPNTYVVKPGDTPIGIASKFGLSVDELMAYNKIKDPTSLRINQKLRIPPPTATPTDTPSPQPTDTATPTATLTVKTTVEAASPTTTPRSTRTASPTATATKRPSTNTPIPAGPSTYVVKPGDTLISIAASVGRSAKAIAVYNKIKDPTSLRVNQELKIPPANYTPPPPTPRPPTATPTPKATPTPSISLAAPVLTNPGNGASFSGSDAFIMLKWQNSGGLPAGIENVLRIGVKVGDSAIDWRFDEPMGQATEFRMPKWLFDQAPQEYGRTYVWYVQAASVAREGNQVTGTSPVSEPSPKWSFHWN